MKKQITGILSGLFMFLMFYLLGCFIETKFDISQWTIGARFYIGLFGFMCSIGAYSMVTIE